MEAKEEEEEATVIDDNLTQVEDEDNVTQFEEEETATVPSNPDMATVFNDDDGPPPPIEVPLRLESEAEVLEFDDGDTEPPSAVVPTRPEDSRRMDQMQRLLVQTQAKLQRVQRAHAELQMAHGSGSASSSMAAAPEPKPPAPSVPSGAWPSKNPSVQLYKKTNCSAEERRKRDLKNLKEDRRKARKKQQFQG
eukprot:s106_g24.t1